MSSKSTEIDNARGKRGPLSRYRELLGRDSALTVLSGSFLAGLSVSVTALGLVLLVNEATHSFAAAGAAMAALGCTNALLAPLTARAVDRRGQGMVLVPLAVLYSLCLLAVIGLTQLDGSAWMYIATSALVGAVVPPVGAALRATWKYVVDSREELTTAYALQNVTHEAYLTLGPLMVGGLVLLGSAKLAIAAAAVLGLGGTLIFVNSPTSRNWGPVDGPTVRSLFGSMKSPGLRVLAISTLGFGLALGTIEIGVAAFAVEFGSAAGAGPLLTMMAFGSIVGGLWHGERAWGSALASRYVVLLTVFALVVTALAFAGAPGPLGVGLFAAGLFVAPAWTCLYGLLDSVAPRGTDTEAYGWLSMANNGGIAAGAALGGILVGASGPMLALLLGAASAFAAGMVALLRHRTLAAGDTSQPRPTTVTAVPSPSPEQIQAPPA